MTNRASPKAMKRHLGQKMTVFRRCTACAKTWKNRNDFLTDPHISSAGYMANFEELELGLFLFNHEVCKTTLAIKAAEFTDLYDGPTFKDRLTDTKDCPGYCLHQSNIQPCPARCECAYVRNVLDKVANWTKACTDASNLLLDE